MSITINISATADENGRKAAEKIASLLNSAIAERARARLVLSTGQSQFEMFSYLVKENVDWTKVEMFHLDEYVNLPITHIASFRRYLIEKQ